MPKCLQCERAAEGKLGLCRQCRLRKCGEDRRKYVWTPQLTAALREAYKFGKEERSKAIRQLEVRTKWPRHAFALMAGDIGLAFCRREWKPEEDAFLSESMGVIGVRTIAARLKRSVESVRSRAARLELSGRVKEGYNISDLAAVMGVHHRTARGWVRRGLLGAAEEREGVRVSEDAVVRFLRCHASEYDLRSVDQVWFKSMIFRPARHTVRETD